MRPLLLTLSGFTRFTTPLTLDLTELPPGLVAVVGGNGEGKTSLLDALGGPVPLWRELSTRADSLPRYCTGRAATVDLTFEYGGDQYRSLLKIDAEARQGAGAMEAFLYGPGCEDTKGRTTDFDLLVRGRPAKDGEAAVVGRFPPKSLYMASAFSAQNRAGNFFGMKPEARKALFADLLALGDLQARAERAAIARKLLDAKMADLDREVARVLEDATVAAELRDQVAGADAALAPLVTAEAQADAGLHAAVDAGQRAVGLLQTLEAARASALKRRADLDAEERAAAEEARVARERIAALEAVVADEVGVRERAAALVIAQADVASAETDWRAARAVSRAATTARDDKRTALDAARTSVTRATAALSGADLARRALVELAPTLAELEQLRADHARLDQRAREEEAVLAPERRRLLDEASTLGAKLTVNRTALDTARKAASLVSAVPCGGRRMLTFGSEADEEVGCGTRADAGTCRFLTDARAASERVPNLELEVADLEARKATTDRAIVDANAREAALTQLRAERDRAAAAVQARVPQEQAAVRHRATVTAAADAQATLDEATARVSTLEADLAVAEAAVVEASSAEAAVAKRGRLAKATVSAHAGADTRLRELEAAAAQLPLLRETLTGAERREYAAALARDEVEIPPDPEGARVDADAANARTAAARQALAAARAAVVAARSNLDVLRGKLAQLGDVAKRRADLEEKRQRVAFRRAGFVLVENAFGRSGIQALEIDAAGPEVSTLTNEILESCFGPRFTVNLRTIQEAGGGRVQKEVFEIDVLDGLRASRGPTDRLSEGEFTLVDEALKLALVVFNARRAGTHIETLYRDEADRGLSDAWASLYPPMLRRAMELGGFRNVFFISHRQQAWEQADVLLRVEGGRAWLE